MCISFITTAHPKYPFILLNNRDEFLSRPTARAHWWETPHQHVLGGRDLQRDVHGTWLAITRDGRIANLTNFRDEDVEVALDRSRGALPLAYVTPPTEQQDDDEAFVRRLVDDLDIQSVGGFTLLFGRFRKPKDGRVPGLAVVSNRTSSTEEVKRLCTKIGDIDGLSNSHYGDRTWPKVVYGEELLKEAMQHPEDDENAIISRLFAVLSTDTLPKPRPGEPFQTFTRQLRHSIFIPPVGGEEAEQKAADKLASANGYQAPDNKADDVKVGSGVYGTQRQSVILVNHEGKVTFVERALYDGPGGQRVPEQERHRRFDFYIEGWSD